MASKGCIIPKMLVEAALFLALFAYGKAQSVTCPPLDPLRLTHNPYSINGLQCKWMITVDQYGCRNVLNDCSTGPSPCQNGGEVLWQCSTCEPSCANLSPTCSNHCGPPSCQCAPGLVRDISSGSCIRPDKCRLTQPTPPLPPQCKFGEVLVRQNCSKLTCERQCEGPPNCNQLCNQLLCICAEGYFRASNGECVAQEQCKTARTPCIMDSDCSSGICGDNKFCTQGGPSRRNDTEILICGFTGCTNHHCNWDDDCHPGAKCINNRCNRGGCHAWSDCPANTGCIDNQCIAVELRPNFCQTDDHCPGASGICVANRCATGCRFFSDCPQNTVCVSGTCHRLVATVREGLRPHSCLTDNQCGTDDICIANRCQKRCRSDNNCPHTQRCFNSLCVVVSDPPPLCRNNFDCGFGNNCIGGLCRSGASFA
uniref:TIL domain-containing protein n=1 Tax=Panagrellus redivivus TaxID=6233 RepID=A0A7E4UVD8_PANRE